MASSFCRSVEVCSFLGRTHGWDKVLYFIRLNANMQADGLITETANPYWFFGVAYGFLEFAISSGCNSTFWVKDPEFSFSGVKGQA
jgi:hypothetical protein